MKKQVPEKILAAAAERCRHGHSCLDTGRCGERQVCRVHYADGDNILILEDGEPAECPNRFTYGYSQVCRCPLHFHLYKWERT